MLCTCSPCALSLGHSVCSGSSVLCAEVGKVYVGCVVRYGCADCTPFASSLTLCPTSLLSLSLLPPCLLPSLSPSCSPSSSFLSPPFLPPSSPPPPLSPSLSTYCLLPQTPVMVRRERGSWGRVTGGRMEWLH